MINADKRLIKSMIKCGLIIIAIVVVVVVVVVIIIIIIIIIINNCNWVVTQWQWLFYM